MEQKTLQFGTWPSPMSPELIAGDLRFSDVQWDRSSGCLLWKEDSDGVGTVVMQEGKQAFRALTQGHSVSAGVGYGGGDFTVAQGTLYYVKKGGRIYSQKLSGGGAKALTPEYADSASLSLSPDGK